MPPLVSAIVGVYNREAYLREALDSILAQTYPAIELIVVDDGSTNAGVFRIYESYGNKIRLIRRDRNSGTCELARYQGVKAARGAYCAFLDSDDLWEPHKIEEQIAFMEAHPKIPLCHTYTWVIDERGRRLRLRHEGVIPPTGVCARQLVEHCFISISSVMVRPRFWLDAVPEEKIRHLGMEWDFLLAIARQHEIGFLPEPLACYRQTPGGAHEMRWRWAPRDVIAMRRHRAEGLWKGVVTPAEGRRLLVEALLENSQFWRDRGHPVRAVYFAASALREQFYSKAAWSHLIRGAGSPARGLRRWLRGRG